MNLNFIGADISDVKKKKLNLRLLNKMNSSIHYDLKKYQNELYYFDIKRYQNDTFDNIDYNRKNDESNCDKFLVIFKKCFCLTN